MENPMVSVVVPIYNTEKYLDRCVDSVINQTYKNIEVILIDDGSTDNSSKMCDEFAKKDSRIKVIHKENAGLGMARNTGIENANGKYICFFDSDDFVDIMLIEKSVISLEASSADACIFGRYDFYENGKKVAKSIDTKKQLFENESVVNDLLPAMFSYKYGFGVSAWSKLFLLSTIKNFGISFKSEREIISEDSYFALEFFSKASRVAIINENLYYYYKRNDSLSREYKCDRQIKNDAFLDKCIELINSSNLPETVASHLKVRYHLFTLAALKQILTSSLEKKQKREELYKTYRSSVLKKTLEKSVLKLHRRSIRLFFTLVRLKCFALSTLFLKIRLSV